MVSVGPSGKDKVTFAHPNATLIHSPPSTVINTTTVTKPARKGKSVTLDGTFEKPPHNANAAKPPTGPRARSASNYQEIHSEFDALSPEERSRFTSDSDAALSSPRRQTVTVNKSQVSCEIECGTTTCMTIKPSTITIIAEDY